MRSNTLTIVADQSEEGGLRQGGLGRLNGPRGLSEFQAAKTYVQHLA